MTTTSTKSVEQAPPAAGSLSDLLGSVIESLPMAMVLFDKRLQVTLSNRSAQDLLRGEQDLGVALSRLGVEGRFEDWATELRQVMTTQLPRRLDVSIKNSDRAGETYLNVMVSPLRINGEASASGGLLLAEDVSSHISMERRLAVSERLAAVGKLAARVAHELNNPLDGILRFTNLALRRASELGDPKIVEYLESARSAVHRLAEIGGDLLEFSRATPSTFEQATINKLVEDALSAMEGRAQEARITVVCNFHESDMPVVRGSNLFQIFCNLIKNSIDAMPDGGTLTVTTRIAEPDVIVTVTDTGVGLPADADRIFEPFFTTKPVGSGTGLGLAVSKELIEKYSGSISASRNEPKGTVMTVRIPIRNCEATPLHKQAGHQRDSQITDSTKPGDNSR